MVERNEGREMQSATTTTEKEYYLYWVENWQRKDTFPLSLSPSLHAPNEKTTIVSNWMNLWRDHSTFAENNYKQALLKTNKVSCRRRTRFSRCECLLTSISHWTPLAFAFSRLLRYVGVAKLESTIAVRASFRSSTSIERIQFAFFHWSNVNIIIDWLEFSSQSRMLRIKSSSLPGRFISICHVLLSRTWWCCWS